MRGFLVACLLALALPVGALGSPEPKPRDLCPVCGMVVSKYPAWIASVVYKDGHAHHFDGAKDLFKYLFDVQRYARGHRREDIARIGVTEYYGLKRVDARQAWYVIGSDVLGPMGHELIPLASREDAEEFLRDHRGRRILRFDEVTRDLPGRLDAGRF
ncbi:MAG: nitrous oxide reductase accessory protein NosL [Betaproteobacteria bacterium]|nr:nitrous oxide reductase accessory protein NosL [Betaproteobacteria bacterium]